MRKIISLSLLALLFSLLSGQALAGKVEVCEQQKQELKALGLYGLCNAYWNAGNENARAQILASYEEKAGLDGPSMPGLDECPCWTRESGSLDLAVGPYSCEVFDNFVSAVYADNNVAYTVMFADPDFTDSCFFENGQLGADYLGLSQAQLTACVKNVENLIARDFSPEDYPNCYPTE